MTVVFLGLVSGLGFAAIFALIAQSLTLVLAASGVFNFAQGSIVMGATIVTYLLTARLGWHPSLVLLASVAAGMVGGLLTYAMAVRPVLGRSHALSHTTVLTTIGLGTAANAVVLLLFGGDTYPVPSFVSEEPLRLLGQPIRPIYVVMVVVGITLTFAFDRLMHRTSIGHLFRATLEDREGAALMGIDTRKVMLGAFIAAGAFSALAGWLAAPVVQASAFAAHDMMFYGFAGMAIGGFGSFAGALVGGVLVGLIYGLVPVLLDSHLTVPAMWAVVVLVLLVKPAGLLGTAGLFGSARLREI